MKVKNFLRRSVDLVLDVWLPHRCVVCRRLLPLGTDICKDGCLAKLEEMLITEKTCPKCGVPKDTCTCKDTVYMFSGLAAPFRYDGTAATAAVNFKHDRCGENAELLASYMTDCAKEKLGTDFDIVCSVPQSPRKRIGTGFDHSGLLAGKVAEGLSVPYFRALKQIKENRMQHTLTLSERRKNIKGIYSVTADVKGKKILLIDDIKTSGSTFNECAHILRLAGADDVKCLAFAVRCKKVL